MTSHYKMKLDEVTLSKIKLVEKFLECDCRGFNPDQEGAYYCKDGSNEGTIFCLEGFIFKIGLDMVFAAPSYPVVVAIWAGMN